jgi:hypothetical protein
MESPVIFFQPAQSLLIVSDTLAECRRLRTFWLLRSHAK